MQKENNEPGCFVLFRTQEKLNWSLPGTITPVVIMLLNYTQESCVSSHQPPNERDISTALCPIGYAIWHQFHLEICLLPSLFPLLSFCLKGHVVLVANTCFGTHMFLQHKGHEHIWEEPHTPLQAARPQIPIAFSFIIFFFFPNFSFPFSLSLSHFSLQ